MPEEFIPQNKNYKSLLVYRKSECLYDLTFYFTEHFLGRGDRTVDQMVQAARSCKQNIAEGSAASVTSRETQIKLTNVAKSSLKELKEDYEDFLRVRDCPQWKEGEEKFEKTRQVCREHNDSEFFREIAPKCSATVMANIAIILCNQTDFLLFRLIESQKKTFLEKGGIREEMTRARLEARKNQPPYSQPPTPNPTPTNKTP